MRVLAVVIGAVAVVVVVAAASTAGGDEAGRNLTPEQQQRVDDFEQAVKDAGLDDERGVRGRYVEGKGWEVEKAPRDADGYVRFAPLSE